MIASLFPVWNAAQIPVWIVLQCRIRNGRGFQTKSRWGSATISDGLSMNIPVSCSNLSVSSIIKRDYPLVIRFAITK